MLATPEAGSGLCQRQPHSSTSGSGASQPAAAPLPSFDMPKANNHSMLRFVVVFMALLGGLSAAIYNEVLQFFVINAIGLGINELVVLGLHPLFSRILPDPPAYLGAKIIAIGIVLFWNYFVNRKWTYRGID